MDFAELLEALRSGEAPETVYDDLLEVHSHVVNEADSARAKIAAEESNARNLADKVAELKAKNWDLIQAVQVTESSSSNNDNDDDDTHKIMDYTDLFNFKDN